MADAFCSICKSKKCYSVICSYALLNKISEMGPSRRDLHEGGLLQILHCLTSDY